MLYPYDTKKLVGVLISLINVKNLTHKTIKIMKKVKDHLNEQKYWDIFTISEDSIYLKQLL